MNEFVGYQAVHEAAMRLYWRSLPEDHRRRYAAIEALKIGYGGVAVDGCGNPRIVGG